MPRLAPAPHNPGFDARLAAFLQRYHRGLCPHAGRTLRELTPHAPVTTNLRAFGQQVDLFDVGEVLDFVSLNSNATIKSKSPKTPAKSIC